MEAFKLVGQQQKSPVRVNSATPERKLKLYLPIKFDDSQSLTRHQVEEFIQARFKHIHNAEINHFLANLLSISFDNRILAALGFQVLPDNAPVFLEQYLPEPVEDIITSKTGHQVARNSIIEIGNLVSGRQQATHTLFVLLAEILYRANYEWVVFTANDRVQHWLAQLGLSRYCLGEATPDVLPDQGASWGTYYDDKPKVYACHIAQGVNEIKADDRVKALFDAYELQLEVLSNTLKTI